MALKLRMMASKGNSVFALKYKILNIGSNIRSVPNIIKIRGFLLYPMSDPFLFAEVILYIVLTILF